MLRRLPGVGLWFLALTAVAGDWPQILGPDRNGQAVGEALPDRWGEAGPKVVWKAKIGAGYAGPAVVGERVVLFHRRADQECVEAFDAAMGQSLWKADFPAHYGGGIDPDKGPRCVPTVAQGRVFAFGAAGDLYAVDLTSGKKLWVRNLYEDYGGDEGYFGAGSAPILIAGKLLVNVGGKNAGIVALDPATGKTLWKATSDAASYAAPAAAVVGDKELAIFVTRLNALAVDPESGKVNLLSPFGKRGPTVNAATPLVVGDQIFLSASYGIGAQLLRFDGRSTKTVWANDDTLSSQYATAVDHNGFLYGCHGREDAGPAEFRCVELGTGRVRWSQPGFGVAHVIGVGDKLLVIKVDGEISIVRANTQKFEQLARFEPPLRGKLRALPALSGGHLYVRSTDDRGGELLCIAVAK
jgi:hypothetical protein